MTIVIPTQFDKELSREEAKAACGPTAAAAFVQINGRNPTVREALSLAQARNLWDQNAGMHGPDSEVSLIEALGGKAYKENGTNWAKVRAEVEAGHPVIIDSAAHYFIATGYDADKDQFYFGASGTAIPGGNEWMAPGRMATFNAQFNTNPRASIFVDNPTDGSGEQTDYGQGGVQAVAGEGDWTGGAFITPTQGAALVQANGPITGNTRKPAANGGRVPILTPSGRETGRYQDNPDPTWHVEYTNGKYLDVIPTRGPDGQPDGNWQIVGGTAKPPDTNATGDKSEGWHWVNQSDGSKVAYTNATPNNPTRPVVDVNGDIVTSARAGSTETQAQANQRAAAADASRASAEHSRALTAQVGKPTPQTPAEQAATEALTRSRDAQTIKDQQALLPKQMLLLQQAQATIDYIRRGIAAGTLTTAQADRYMSQVHTYVDAGMRGTTPFDEYKLAEEEATRRAATAAGLINQQVSSTTSLAEKLLGDQTIEAQHSTTPLPAMSAPMAAGIAQEAVTRAQGGQQVNGLAQTLLSALQPGGGGATVGADGLDPNTKSGLPQSVEDAMVAKWGNNLPQSWLGAGAAYNANNTPDEPVPEEVAA